MRKIEKVHVVPVRNTRSTAAVIDTARQRVTPDFHATSRTSPTLVTLADPATGSPTDCVAVGTSAPGATQRVRTYRLSDLAPGPVSELSKLAGDPAPALAPTALAGPGASSTGAATWSSRPRRTCTCSRPARSDRWRSSTR